MIKKTVLLSCTVLLLSVANAGNHFGRQPGVNNDKKFSFSFNAGIGIPTAGFANKDSIARTDTTHAHGFANKGFHFDIGVSYRFTQYVGVAIRIGGSICSFNNGAYASAFNIPSTEDVSANGSHYIGEYFGGPYFYIPVNNNFSVEAKAMFGIVSAQYPDISIESNQPNNLSGRTFKFAHAQDFGYCFSLGGKIKLDDMVGLSITVGYTGSTMYYPGQVYSISTSSGYTYSGFSFADRQMKLGIISITGGLVISF